MKKPGILFLFLITVRAVLGQDVVVNGYFNAADPRDEWIELLVVSDNTDMRNWTLRDNNGSQNSWQTAVTFQNISFWNNMRAGTVIMVWNRMLSSTGVSHATIDVNKGDGYVELSAQDAAYFSGGAFGSSPTWAGNSLNIAGSGEIIELRNASAAHVHGLGHQATAGSDWTAMATPKLNHANSASSGDAIYVCPGASLADYNGPATGNNFTSKNNSTITFGLPNTCGASTGGNAAFWNSLREPVFASQTLTPTIVGGNPGSISFSWNTATDPYAIDNTTGYIVLKNTVNTFSNPLDGFTYSVGSTIGTATVVAQTSSSASISYTDNTINSENCYYYRVYAFRYGSDDINGNNYNVSRGRAYNQTNYAFVPCITIVLPVELMYFNGKFFEGQTKLEWATFSEVNTDFFTVEKSPDGKNFEEAGRIKAKGMSSEKSVYSYLDKTNDSYYYRLRQTDINGVSQFSGIIYVSGNEKPINIYPLPVTEGKLKVAGIDGEFSYELLDGASGKPILTGKAFDELTIMCVPDGVFYLKLTCGNKVVYRKIISVKE